MAFKPNMRPDKNPMPTQDPAVRARNFHEVAEGYSDEAALDEAMRELMIALRRTLEHPTDCYNVASAVLDSWTPTNPSNELPKISDVRPYSYIDSRYVEKSDYLKLRTLSIGYHFKLEPSRPTSAYRPRRRTYSP